MHVWIWEHANVNNSYGACESNGPYTISSVLGHHGPRPFSEIIADKLYSKTFIRHLNGSVLHNTSYTYPQRRILYHNFSFIRDVLKFLAIHRKQRIYLFIYRYYFMSWQRHLRRIKIQMLQIGKDTDFILILAWQ